MVFRLISATPSPYARKVRITLHEKGIPFELVTEVPWDSTTQTPKHNPLEKLPILILEDGSSSIDTSTAVYESHYIIEWLEFRYGAAQGYISVYPHDKEDELLAKRIQVVTDGMCDALVLLIFERMREHPSQQWMDRQLRKLNGGLRALSEWVEGAGEKDFIIGDGLTLADIAIGSVLGFMRVRYTWNTSWQDEYPELMKYSLKLDERPSFKETMPFPQSYKDKIV